MTEKGEECDPPGACPGSCPNLGCTKFVLTGAASVCTARCVESGQETACRGGDGCCPTGCTVSGDSDCSVVCGDGTKESNETCDPLSSCPTTCPIQGCQLRKLVNGGTCTAECVSDRLQTACVSGDGCCPPGCNNASDNDCAAESPRDAAATNDVAPVDTIKPYVTSVTPAEGALVPEGTPIIITFSEPMNTGTVAAAFVPDSVPTTPLDFSWNPDGTQLRVDAHLRYPEGADPAVVERVGFGFTLTTDAIDLAGNPLTAGVQRAFSLRYRRIHVDAPFSQDLSGNCTIPCSGNFTFLQIGESSTFAELVAVATFVFTDLPVGAVLETAVLMTQIELFGGAPFPGFGNVHAADVEFAVKGDGFTVAGTEVGTLIPASSLPAPGKAYQLDVTSTFANDYARRAQNGYLTQYRFAFDSPDAGLDAVADHLRLLRPATRVAVTYLIE